MSLLSWSKEYMKIHINVDGLTLIAINLETSWQCHFSYMVSEDEWILKRFQNYILLLTCIIMEQNHYLEVFDVNIYISLHIRIYVHLTSKVLSLVYLYMYIETDPLIRKSSFYIVFTVDRKIYRWELCFMQLICLHKIHLSV